MLIFRRGLGQTIRIAENIYCTVLGFKNNQVRLGFSAPNDVDIYTEEIYLKIPKIKMLKPKPLNHTETTEEPEWELSSLPEYLENLH